MGTKPASVELHKALQPIFVAIPEAHVIHDDVIIGTVSKEHHIDVSARVLKKIEESGLTLNPDKCIFNKQEVPFLGMIVTNKGLKPDPSKVEALEIADRPRSNEEVVLFRCMVQSNSDFIPQLARKTVNLRQLTEKHARFHWSSACQAEFNELKNALREDAPLRYFDPSLKTYLFTDAHITGISAILAQGTDSTSTNPIAFASRATTPVKRRYAQLDLEALSTDNDFALRRFRMYYVGGPPPQVTVLTDHKPLISIFALTASSSVTSTLAAEWNGKKEAKNLQISYHGMPLLLSIFHSNGNRRPMSLKKQFGSCNLPHTQKSYRCTALWRILRRLNYYRSSETASGSNIFLKQIKT